MSMFIHVRWRILFWGAILLIAWPSNSSSRAGADHSRLDNDQTVQSLIERLGSRQFAQREKARDELRQLGVVAFESLHAAQYHADVEVRKQAEYLLRAIRIAWTQEDDPEIVKQQLRRYQQEEHDVRLERLTRLGNLADGRAIPALCRLARFETSEILSKRAALTVMRYAMADPPVDLERAPSEIQEVMGNSQREAARWLRIYARYLVDPESTLEAWQQVATDELAAVRHRPDKDRMAVLQDLLRWQIEMLQRLGRDAEMLAVLQQLLPLQGDSREELRKTVEWLLDRQAWSLIDDLVRAFAIPFQEDAYLLYRRAEAEMRQGRSDVAQGLAEQALAVKADGKLFLHVDLGTDLQSRGLVQWAENEYRHAIKVSEPGTHLPIAAAIRLGWMFHDLDRNHEAYEAFKQLVELMSKDKNVARRVQELSWVPIRVQGQMHFSRALELAEQKQWDEHRKELEQALKYDRENADIIIAMYRVPNADDAWQEKTQRRVEVLRDRYVQQVARAERDAAAVPGSATNLGLAQALNQYAWLVSNTTGDYDAALRGSLRSLELIGDTAGYLDTLARCYFAVGDYAAALKQQQRAVALEPHTGQIRRQLEVFQEIVKEKGPGTPHQSSHP